MYTCILFVILQTVLFGSVLSQSTPTQSAADIVQTAYASVKDYKSNFENVKLKRDKDFRNRLFEVINAADDELFSFLRPEFFLPEDSKSNYLVEALRDTTDQDCVTGLRAFNREIWDTQGREEFKYCAEALVAKREQLKEVLSGAAEAIKILNDEAELNIKTCKTVYDLRGNISALSSCVVAAQVNLKNAAADLDQKYENLNPDLFVTGLAQCIDSTVLNMQQVLNKNYELIKECLNTSSNSLAVDLSALLPSYIVKESSIALEQVTEALANLGANSSTTFANIAAVKAKIEQVLQKRNRDFETTRLQVLSTNENVVKYESALNDAKLKLKIHPRADSCVTDANNEYKNWMIYEALELRSCVNAVKQITSVGDITTLENLLTDRLKNEAEVAIVLCLSANGVVSQDRTAFCSDQADRSFENYLASEDVKLNQASQKADLISAQINTCERGFDATILSVLGYLKVKFEACVLSRAAVDFAMSYN